jgi:hypothetical protein
VKVAEAHGIHPTARALGVDYYSLKERLEKKSAAHSRASSANGAAFVELATPAQMALQECILELEDVEGAKMRIHLKGIEAPDLAALSRTFWGVK